MHETSNCTVVHRFAVMTIVWGIVGMDAPVNLIEEH